MAKVTFVTGLTRTLENERVIWVRCSDVMFDGTLPVVVLERLPEVPAWPEPGCPAAPGWLAPPAWPAAVPDVPADPDCVLCEPAPDPAAPALEELEPAEPPDVAADPPWLDMPPLPEAEGELAPPPLVPPLLEPPPLPAPPLGDAAAPPPLDPPAPLPLPLVCAMPAATLKAKAATAAVLNNP
jgi:hypothetical protein